MGRRWLGRAVTQNGQAYGERDKLREIFNESAQAGNKKTVERESISLAMAKMGISREKDFVEGVVERRGRQRRRRSVAQQSAPESEQMTLWDLEREVGESRLETTMEESKLHRVLAKALMQHKTRVTTWTKTETATASLCTPHLFSWLVQLPRSTLRFLIEEVYEDAKEQLVEEIEKSVDHLRASTGESESPTTGNSKFATWVDTFDGKTKVGNFGQLDQFKKVRKATCLRTPYIL